MKLASFIGLFALLGQALALAPTSFDFAANVWQGSMFTAGFRDDARIAEENPSQELKFDLEVPNDASPATEYQDIACVVQLDIDGSQQSIRAMLMSRHEASPPRHTALIASYTLLPSEVLNEFKLFCSFTSPLFMGRGPYTSTVKVSYGSDTATNVTDRALFNTQDGLAQTVHMYISNQPTSSTPTKFSFLFPSLKTRHVTVATPRVTFGTEVSFESTSPLSFCHAYNWRHHIPRENSVLATVSSDGYSVALKFDFDLDSEAEVHVECPKLYGTKNIEGVPSVLVAYSDKYANHAISRHNSVSFTDLIAEIVTTFFYF